MFFIIKSLWCLKAVVKAHRCFCILRKLASFQDLSYRDTGNLLLGKENIKLSSK